jgi:hypothetical protein
VLRRGCRPFLLVTPLGLARRRELAHALDDGNVAVVDRHPLPAWSVVSTQLYSRPHRHDRRHVETVYADAWRRLDLPDECERWDVRTLDDLARLRPFKEQLRGRLGATHVTLDAPVGALPAGAILRLNPFHTPDSERLDIESAILDRLQLTTF